MHLTSTASLVKLITGEEPASQQLKIQMLILFLKNHR